jgi:hypothetical protein
MYLIAIPATALREMVRTSKSEKKTRVLTCGLA